jgi:hypothetical protein
MASIGDLLQQVQGSGNPLIVSNSSDTAASIGNVDVFLLQVFLDKIYSLDSQIKSMMTGADYRKQLSLKLQQRIDYLQKVMAGDKDAIDPDNGQKFSDGHDLGMGGGATGAATVDIFMKELAGDRVNSKAAQAIKGEMDRVQGLLRQSNQESDRDMIYLQQLNAQKSVLTNALTTFLKGKEDDQKRIAGNF